MKDNALHGVVSENKGGQPSKYKDEYAKQAYKLCLLGSIDKDLADFFEVCEATINNWKHDYPEFLESITGGKLSADATVAKSLYKRCNGYEQPEDKIFNANGEPLVVPTTKHVAPDITAIMFWLKNRQPKLWRDKSEIDNTSSDGSMSPQAKPDYSGLTDDELRQYIALESKAASTTSGVGKP